MIRRLLLAVLVLIVVAIGAVVLAPTLIPASAIKGVVISQGEQATGRAIAIDGDVSVTVLPRIGVRMAGVSLANAPGFGDEPLAELEELRVAVALAPLFSGKVEVEELVLVRPVARLEQRADGSNNWTFEPQAATADPAPAPTPEPVANGALRTPDALPMQVALGDVRISEGQAVFIDAATDTRHGLSNINLTVSMPAMDAPLQLDGDLALNGEPMRLMLSLETVQSFFAGAETPVRLSLDSAPLRFSADGHFTESQDVELVGAVNVEAPSLRDLAGLAGVALPPSAVEGQPAFERLAISGQAALDPDTASFQEAQIALDAITGAGSLRVDLAGEKPAIVGVLQLGMLELTPYAPATPDTVATGDAGAEATPPLEPWSDDPLDYSALDAADAQFELTVEGLKFGDITLGAGRLSASMENGRFAAALQRLDAYGGALIGAVEADASGRTPQLSVNLTLEQVQAAPLLRDAAGFEQVSGLANFRIEAAGDGRSMATLMNSLAGAGSFAFSEGRVDGVDLEDAAKAIEELLDGRIPNPRGFGQGQSTSFASLTGTFNITEGVARMDDLRLENPILVMDGRGDLDLGGQRLDMRLEPLLIAAPDSDLAEIPIPLRVSGPWNDVRASIDRERSGALLRDFLRQEAEEAAIEEIGDAVRSLFNFD